MVTGFSVVYRNPGHWDIYSNKTRAFRIRGGVGERRAYITVIGEYDFQDATPGGWIKFNSLTTAMAWITDYLMHEPVQSENREK